MPRTNLHDADPADANIWQRPHSPTPAYQEQWVPRWVKRDELAEELFVRMMAAEPTVGTTKEAAEMIGKQPEDYEPHTDWPYVVAKLAYKAADRFMGYQEEQHGSG